MLRSIQYAVLASAASLAALGCCENHHDAHAAAANRPILAADVAPEMKADIKDAVAVIHGTKGNEKVTGVVHFTAADQGVKVVADIDGLEAGSEHAFHIHEFGDTTDPEAKSAGGHYNPEKHEHGKPGSENAHPGDMGNLKADDKGHAHLELALPSATINGKNAILGRGVIVHAKPDDFSQPVGNAGARIGAGVIGITQVKK